MSVLRKFKRRFAHYAQTYREYFPLKYQKKYFKCVTLRPRTGPARGRVLVSYALAPAGLPDEHPTVNTHGCYLMNNAIIRIFNDLGYTVDCVQYTNRGAVPNRRYFAVFSFCLYDLPRLTSLIENTDDVIKIWQPAIAAISSNNAREMERVRALEKRRPGAAYFPKCQEPFEQMERKMLEYADYIVPLGGEYTISTFPEEYRYKLVGVGIAASAVYKKPKERFVPSEREFVWHFGMGSVRKGLDLLLEVFARNPQWMLHVTGSVAEEKDFMKIYHKELTSLPNIHFHGRVMPNSERFRRIADRCIAFVAPSVSESLSTACASMMQCGLYPMVTRETGVELPEGVGVYLDDCSIEGLEQSIKKVHEMDEGEIARQIEISQAFALTEYSGERFEENMRNVLSEVVKKHDTSAV